MSEDRAEYIIDWRKLVEEGVQAAAEVARRSELWARCDAAGQFVSAPDLAPTAPQPATDHRILLAVQRQVQGLTAERDAMRVQAGALAAQVAALVEERDALREDVAEREKCRALAYTEVELAMDRLSPDDPAFAMLAGALVLLEDDESFKRRCGEG